VVRQGYAACKGATLTRSASVSFNVAAGDTLRLQQLLAQLDYLPAEFVPSGPSANPADMAIDQAGSFNWRWATLPTELTSQWTQGTSNEITRAAVEDFENQNGLGVDGIAGPAVWTALINDALNKKVSGTPYVYVLVNKVLRENLTL
jgi:peptidoglycan hydrolase-like protein with peptidoglycan-binding domain